MSFHAEEKELVHRMLTREREAWNEFVLQFQGIVCARIVRTARECRVSLSQSDRDDLCADVFASLLQNDLAPLRQFQGKSSLATWLSVIARRTCLRTITRRRMEHLESDGADLAQCAEEFDSLHQLIESEQQAQVQRQFDLLGEADQQILKLFHHEELGYSEISQRLGVSINTVGPKLHRAHQRLRKLMRWV